MGINEMASCITTLHEAFLTSIFPAGVSPTDSAFSGRCISDHLANSFPAHFNTTHTSLRAKPLHAGLPGIRQKSSAGR